MKLISYVDGKVVKNITRKEVEERIREKVLDDINPEKAFNTIMFMIKYNGGYILSPNIIIVS